jgi:uncharacterized protein
LAGVLLLGTAFTWAEPVSQLHATNYVNDFAHVLDSDTTIELNDICRQLDQKAQVKVAVVTINSTDSDPIEDYAVTLLKQWGLGTKESNRGVLILLAVKDRKYRTEVGYGLEPILPDGKVGGFWREAVPLLKQGDYSGAVRLTTERVAAVIAQDSGIQLTGAQPPPVYQQPHISLAAVVLFIVIAIIVLATPLRRVLFWWLLFSGGPRWGGGGAGWGGGGFGGGGGGGGGFGGFGGGGSSGGGGASGGW